MRGPLENIDPLLAPVLYSFKQADEDISRHTEGLSSEEMWVRPHGFGSVGFHIRHIAGSVDRLTTYLQDRQLNSEQLVALDREMDPGASREDLLDELQRAFAHAERVIRSLERNVLAETRAVGRRRLPTTVIGLLVHIAEHTQRHVGQAISAAKLARAAKT